MSTKSYKSNITATKEAQLALQAGKLCGEDAFIVEPLQALIIDKVFPRVLPQKPIVQFSIQSDSDCPTQAFITDRSEKGFQVTIHNEDPIRKLEGILLWYSFILP